MQPRAALPEPGSKIVALAAEDRTAPSLAALPAYPVPDAETLTRIVLADLDGAADAKAARAVVVRHLQAAKTAASAGFEAAFRASPRQARGLVKRVHAKQWG